MSGVTVVWNAVNIDDPESTISGDCKTVVSVWADYDDHGQQSAQTICEGYFTADVWDAEFGSEETSAEVKLTIYSPANIAGDYGVTMKRVVEAKAERIAVRPG